MGNTASHVHHITTQRTVPGGTTFLSGGRAKVQALQGTSPAIGVNRVSEFAHKLRIDASRALGVQYTCVLTTIQGGDLNSVPSTLPRVTVGPVVSASQ